MVVVETSAERVSNWPILAWLQVRSL